MFPHKLNKDTVIHTQSNIIIALIPIIIWSVYVFGTRTLMLLSISVICAVLTELSLSFLSKSLSYFSILKPLIYGFLSALVLPVSAPLWAFALGGFISSIIGFISLKGSCSANIINPVASSGIILYGLFESAVNRFSAPFETFSFNQLSTPDCKYVTTILQSIKNGNDSITNSTLINTFLGRDAGAMGEVSALLIIIGGFFIIWKKYISWHIPVLFTSTFFLLSFFFPTGNCEAIYSSAAETLSGGVFLASFFVASLPCSSPITKSGKIIFGFLCGFFTFILRRFFGIVDGALFATAIVSCFSQMIDFLTGNKYFAYISDKKKANEPKKTNLEELLKD